MREVTGVFQAEGKASAKFQRPEGENMFGCVQRLARRPA